MEKAETIVKVLVRNVYGPSNEAEEFLVNTNISIATLKTCIYETFTSHPLPSHQKLIFGGKICVDHDILGNLLMQHQILEHTKDNQEDGELQLVVFHLMIPAAYKPSIIENIEKVEEKRNNGNNTIESVSISPEINSQTYVENNQDITMQEEIGDNSVPIESNTAQESSRPSMNEDIYRQQFLIHQQAMVLAQIQYLQHVKRFIDTCPQESSQYNPYFMWLCGANMFGMFNPSHLTPQFNGQQSTFGNTHAFPASTHTMPTPTSAQSVPQNVNTAQPNRRRQSFRAALREIYALVDFPLMLKMGFMLFIIGQDTPMDRLILLCTLSFIMYLYISGILAKLYELFTRGHANSRAQGNQHPHRNGRGANVPRELQAHQRAVNAAARAITSLSIYHVTPDGGFLQDIKSFFTALILSLVPAWQIQEHRNDTPDRNNRQVPVNPGVELGI